MRARQWSFVTDKELQRTLRRVSRRFFLTDKELEGYDRFWDGSCTRTRHVGIVEELRKRGRRLRREEEKALFVLLLRGPEATDEDIQKRFPELRLGCLPPPRAQFLLLLVPKVRRECLLGDLNEEYETVVLPRFGAIKARRWYWWQVIACIAPFAWRLFKKAAGAAAVWRLIR